MAQAILPPKLLWYFLVLFKSERGVGETVARVAKCGTIIKSHNHPPFSSLILLRFFYPTLSS